MQTIKTTIVIIIILLILFITLGTIYQSQKNSVQKWADSKEFKIEKIESHITTFGTPFYYLHKGNYIFEIWVITPSGEHEHWWIRKNLFSDDYIKE